MVRFFLLALRSLYSMSNIRILLMSAFFLLLVGVNSNVRAAVNAGKLVQNGTDEDQSEKDSQDHEPKETITELDFFGAFSLVNVQLQWRDFHSGLKDELTDSKRLANKKDLSSEEVKTLNLELDEQVVAASPVIITSLAVVPVSAYRTIDGTTNFKCSQNKQHARTIAYILSCATHPTSC